MIAVRKVETSDVHAALNESLQLGDVPARGSNGAYDFCTTANGVGALTDGIQADESSGEDGDIGRLRNGHILVVLGLIV